MTIDENRSADPPLSDDNLARSIDGTIPERSILATIGLVSGVLGATAVVFGFVLYALDPNVLALGIGNVSVGLVCIVFYVATNWRSLVRTLGGRSLGLFLLEIALGVGALMGTVTLNYLAAKADLEWDLTKDKLYTLHEQSVSIASSLERPVTFIGFFKPGDRDRTVLEGVIELYQRHTERLRLEFIDPDAAATSVLTKYRMSGEGPRIVVVGPEENWTKIAVPTEEAVTNALIKVGTLAPKKVYFLVGHQEPAVDDTSTQDGYGQIATALQNDGHRVDALSLLERENVPEDATVLVVGGARSSLFRAEIEAVRSWLDRGGRALFLLEPEMESGLDELWRRHGIRVNDDLVVEANPTAVSSDFGPDAPVVRTFEEHPITRPLTNSAAIFFRARSIEPMLGLANITVTTLVRTSPTSWGETNYRAGGDQTRDDNDVPGPVPIAVAITRKTAGHARPLKDEARIVVVGDQHFASNRFSVVRGNVDLFLNAVHWLAGDETRITIRPQRRGASRLPLSEVESYGITFLSVNLLPLLVLGFGFSVWAVRRRK